MNLLVAVRAAAVDQTVAPLCERRALVDGRWMPRADVAALAQHRRPHHEHAVVVRAVGVVAGDARLATRGVSHRNGPRFSV